MLYKLRKNIKFIVYIFLILFFSSCGQQLKTSKSSVSGLSALTVTPSSAFVIVNSNLQFTTSGGTPPYYYSISSSSVGTLLGIINQTTGLYTAPGNSGGTAEIKVVDSQGVEGYATVVINTLLSMNPSTRTVLAGDFTPFTMIGNGGVPPYTYQIESGSGSISNAGVFSPPATAGTTVIRVTDSTGDYRFGVVTINPALSVFPPSGGRNVPIGGTLALTAMGGIPPYTYTLISGSGNMTASTYVAPGTGTGTGSAVVRVIDLIGTFLDITINVIDANALSISPATRYIASLPVGASTLNALFSWTIAGGVLPYTYSIVSGPGSINSGSGFYTPPNDGSLVQRTVTIRVTDGIGSTRDATIILQPILRVAPGDLTVSAGSQIRVDGYGSVAPFTYTVISGGGTLAQILSTGSNFGQSNTTLNYATFVAPLSADTTVIRVSDSLNQVKDITITTTGTAVNPDEPTLTLTPTTRIVSARSSLLPNPVAPVFQYSSSGGIAPYVYSIVSGPGAISSTTGVYSPPADSSFLSRTAVVRVTDFVGAYREALIYIQPSFDVITTPYGLGLTALNIDYSLPSTSRNPTVAVNQQIRIDGTGGICQHTFSIFSGSGLLQMFTNTTNNYAQLSINCGYAIFTAPPTAGTSVIQASDLHGNIATSNITVSDSSLGAPDTSYGTSGMTTISFGSGDDIAMAQALDASGKLLIAGYTYNSTNSTYDFAVARLDSSGALDATFGGLGGASAGKSIISVGAGHDYATSIVIQPDGGIVIAGYCQNGVTAYDFCAVRLNSNGTALDTAGFNSPNGYIIYNLAAGNYNDMASSMALQADGKIVIGGTCYGTSTDFCVSRLATNGTLDTTFNTTGIVISGLASSDYGQSLVIDSSGRIYLGGICGTDYCLVRYTIAGIMDTSFPSTGGGRLVFYAGSNWNITESYLNLVMQADGKIVFGGSAATTIGSYYAYVYGRITNDGAMDDTFGVEGRMSYEFSNNSTGTIGSQGGDYLNAIAVQSNGKIVGVGKTFGKRLTFEFSLIRSNADGSLDLNFGSAGRMAYLVPNLGNSNFNGVSIQANGKILATGYAFNGTSYDFVAIRYHP